MFFKAEDVDLGNPVVVLKSEIDELNKIGEQAKELGYDVVFYKTRDISLKSILSIDGFELGWMHYILILKDNKAVLSVYYDDKSMGSLIEVPYFEVYDFSGDPNRYVENEKEDMFKFIKSVLIK